MNILFRADSSSSIGTGHIMRDLVLAERDFPSDKVIFCVQDLEGNINQKIEEAGYEIEILNSNDIDELISIIQKLKIHMLVIDHYGIDYYDEKKLKTKNPKLTIFSFDDTYEKHYCDILLNHNISAEGKRYRDLVPNFCELRCGEKFTLLRDEFYEAKKLPYSRIKNHIPTILIAMGGSDPTNATPKILDILQSFKCKAHVITTTANPCLQSLQTHCKQKGWIKLHVNTKHLAMLMHESDLAIVTPSVTLNEVIFMKLDFIGIKVAKNQEEMYLYAKKNGFLVIDRFENEKLKKLLRSRLKGDINASIENKRIEVS